MATAAAPQPRDTIYKFARVIDGRGHVYPDGIVAVRGSRIRALSKAGSSRGARVVDLTRFTAIPGLIDVHTHMTYYWNPEMGGRPRGQRRHPAVTVFLAQENARRTLEAGVTTVRDLNASGEMDLALRDLIAMRRIVGPRMLVSGQGLSGRPTPPGSAQMRALVDERVKAGVEWIKVFASRGGFEDVTTDRTLSFEEIQAAVDEAHAQGKRIAVHSYGPDAARDAVRAGADSLEHAVDLDDETLAEMARRGTVYVPTVDHNRYYIDARDQYGFPPGAEDELRAYIERNVDTLRRAIKAGVRVAMGSDAVYTMFGQNTRELGWFVKGGMTPAEALASATTIPAELLRMEQSIGALAPGCYADIVAVEGDPLADIDVVINRVRWVMKEGSVVVDRTK